MPLDLKLFPNLHPGNFRDDGPRPNDAKYNCIAWAAGYDDLIWDPIPRVPAEDFYWPPNVPSDYNVKSLIVAFESVGFAICADGSLEAGFEKIAIYSDGPYYEHAARQLETGKWTSKMGMAERIEHDTPQDLEGPAYGQVKAFMKRPRP